MTYRNEKLLRLARDKTCMNCMGTVCQKETVVSAHSNKHSHGRGFNYPSNDCFHAWLGIYCHQWYDHGRGMDPTDTYNDSRVDKEQMFDRARDRTLLYQWQNELIKVA
jgi:hypothetical protein